MVALRLRVGVLSTLSSAFLFLSASPFAVSLRIRTARDKAKPNFTSSHLLAPDRMSTLLNYELQCPEARKVLSESDRGFTPSRAMNQSERVLFLFPPTAQLLKGYTVNGLGKCAGEVTQSKGISMYAGSTRTVTDKH